MTVLVTGGAGYVGSVVVDHLIDRGDDVVVIDNLSRGFADQVNQQARLVRADIGDIATVAPVLAEADAVLHFAGLIAVGESMMNPGLFHEQNIAQGVVFLNAVCAAEIRHFVFSSSAAVYGEPDEIPIPETHRLDPTSTYGWTKLVVELMLADHARADGLHSVSLRYFNAAGATDRRRERHDPETHLIPRVLGAARGEVDLRIFGDDYPTKDGTNVRDYIHVDDLATAHLAALDYLRSGGDTTQINLGTGTGFTVHEVIEAARRVTGLEIPAIVGPRRAGDPASLVASNDRAGRLLGWQPVHTDIEEIVRSAWEALPPV
jgi:UDP-glucose 4-epimerase